MATTTTTSALGRYLAPTTPAAPPLATTGDIRLQRRNASLERALQKADPVEPASALARDVGAMGAVVALGKADNCLAGQLTKAKTGCKPSTLALILGVIATFLAPKSSPRARRTAIQTAKAGAFAFLYDLGAGVRDDGDTEAPKGETDEDPKGATQAATKAKPKA